jgi:glycine cleavage system aminomethyltransferase T
VGLRAEGRQPVRAGATLSDADGNPAGRVTSGGFGPSVEHPVAMGYVPRRPRHHPTRNSLPMSAASRSGCASSNSPSSPNVKKDDAP